MGALKVWNGTAWETASTQGPAGVGSTWERFVDVPAINLNTGSSVKLPTNIVSFTAGATGRLIVDFICKVKWVTANTQRVELSCTPTTPAPTIAPTSETRATMPADGVVTIPVTATWATVTAGQAIAIKLDFLATDTSGATLLTCSGSYRIVPTT